MPILRAVPITALAAFAVACASASPRSSAPGAVPIARPGSIADAAVSGGTTVEAAWATVENRLLSQPALQMSFEVDAVGPVPAHLSGTFQSNAGAVRLSASGQLQGKDVELGMHTEGPTLLLGPGAGSISLNAGPELREAILLGATRMGFLHNLYRLSVQQPPDHHEGGVREYLTIERPTFGGPTTRDGRAVRALSYAIKVGGQEAGTGTLTLDVLSGLPVERTMTVNFPGGTQQVTERFRWTVPSDR